MSEVPLYAGLLEMRRMEVDSSGLWYKSVHVRSANDRSTRVRQRERLPEGGEPDQTSHPNTLGSEAGILV